MQIYLQASGGKISNCDQSHLIERFPKSYGQQGRTIFIKFLINYTMIRINYDFESLAERLSCCGCAVPLCLFLGFLSCQGNVAGPSGPALRQTGSLNPEILS